MSGVSLQELIDSVGINKKELAIILGVTPKTVQRMGDNVSEDVLSAVDEYKNNITQEQSEKVPVPAEKKKAIGEISEILPVTHENIALSRTWHDLDNLQVAQRFGLSRFHYNEEVQKTVIHCLDNNTSFMELRGNNQKHIEPLEVSHEN